MEIKIYSPQDNGFLERIEWNFEELKEGVIASARSYELSVYTDDSIRAAKADRAKLNKFVDALKKERTEIRKRLLKPDEQFGKEVLELTGIVQKAIDNIDGQIKDYEKRKREEKTQKLQDFYEANIHDIGKYLPFERVMRPEYANASTSMKAAQEGILDMIQRVDEGLAILNEVDSPYAGDMKEVFLNTYDLGAAMAERTRLEAAAEKRRLYEEQRAKEKAERETRQKEEAQRVIEAGRTSMSLPDSVEPPAVAAVAEEAAEEPVIVLDFRVHVTAAQASELKVFLKDRGIRFEPVPKQ